MIRTIDLNITEYPVLDENGMPLIGSVVMFYPDSSKSEIGVGFVITTYILDIKDGLTTIISIGELNSENKLCGIYNKTPEYIYGVLTSQEPFPLDEIKLLVAEFSEGPQIPKQLELDY